MLRLNIEHSHQFFECVLSVQTGICQIALFRSPLGESTIIKHLLGVFNNKRHDTKSQTFFQRDQSPDSAVAVLKRMDTFKFIVEADNVVNRDNIQ